MTIVVLRRTKLTSQRAWVLIQRVAGLVPTLSLHSIRVEDTEAIRALAAQHHVRVVKS